MRLKKTKPRKSQFNLFSPRNLLIFFATTFALFGLYKYIHNSQKEAEVYFVGGNINNSNPNISNGDLSIPTGAVPIARKCVKKKVACVKEPCEPILVCDTTPVPNNPSPIPSSSLEPLPTSEPKPTCIPRESCLLSDSECLKKLPANTEYCSPVPTASPNYPGSPVNSKNSPNIAYLSNLSASKPCGVTTFSAFNISCSNKKQTNLGNGACLTFSQAYKLAVDYCQNSN